MQWSVMVGFLARLADSLEVPQSPIDVPVTFYLVVYIRTLVQKLAHPRPPSPSLIALSRSSKQFKTNIKMVSVAAPSYGKSTAPTVRGSTISACGLIHAAGRWGEDLFGGDELQVNVVRSFGRL